MKFALALTLIFFVVYSSDYHLAVDAAPQDSSHAVSHDTCPENSSTKECYEQAMQTSRSYNYCHRFLIDFPSIEWLSCGRAACLEGVTELVPEDINKPFPDCCERCQLIIDRDE